MLKNWLLNKTICNMKKSRRDNGANHYLGGFFYLFFNICGHRFIRDMRESL